ncbi:MAG: glycoside hydrolase family 28 protein [Bacilli bacterium]
MKLKILFLSAFNITIEIENNTPFYTKETYEVFLNGEVLIAGGNKNVFSLAELKPNKNYHLLLKTDNQEAELSFQTPEVKYLLSVKAFKAKGDGITDDTLSIQAAIAACPKDGIIYVPEGKYLVKSLFLKSNLKIYLSKDAKLIGSINRDDYAILPGVIKSRDDELVLGSWEGNPLDIYTSLITGINVENVMIFGEGEIDCSGNLGPWWLEPKKKFGAYRPRGIFLNACKRVLVQGISLRNSPSWSIHPFYSDDLSFYDLKILNPEDAANTDGLNPESCRNVEIIGVHFSVGDDCIAIKSGKIYMAKKHYRPTSNLVIRNCLMEKGHGAVVFGSEISGGAENVTVSKCAFIETDRGLRIKTRRGRGNKEINNVKFDNIYMRGVKNAFVINMFYFCDPDGKTEYVYSKKPLPVDERTPALGSFHFRNIVAEETKISAGFFYGLPESAIAEVVLEDIKMSFSEEAESGKPAMMSFIEDYSKLGFYFNNVQKVRVKNVTITGQNGEKFCFENVTEIIKE